MYCIAVIISFFGKIGHITNCVCRNLNALTAGAEALEARWTRWGALRLVLQFPQWRVLPSALLYQNQLPILYKAPLYRILKVILLKQHSTYPRPCPFVLSLVHHLYLSSKSAIDCWTLNPWRLQFVSSLRFARFPAAIWLYPLPSSVESAASVNLTA